MTQTVPLSEFMQRRRQSPVVDVRTPAEFSRGHIPGAANLPLFNDRERAEVGATYHQTSREAAILLGLDYVGPKLRPLLEQMHNLFRQSDLLFYCWRGGMRSQSLAWLAELYGYRAYTLAGGYKAFRTYVVTAVSQPLPIIILGGMTGSGKTEILQALAQIGQQTLDLEGLARHKGSVFGGLGQPAQPSQQQFENQLGLAWRELRPEPAVWLEDESFVIGQIKLPQPLWQQMQQAPTLFIEVPLALRVERLVEEYGRQEPAKLAEAILKLQKRLGGFHTTQALTALDRGDLERCCTILLNYYYDKTYRHCLAQKDPKLLYRLSLDSPDPVKNAQKILQAGWP
jgi:tRNA 2-selenouridine synthase